MSRERKSLNVIACLVFVFAAVKSANADDVFKGTVKGTATFTNGQGPGGGFQTTDASGQLTHMGKSLVVLDMAPNKGDAGTAGHGFSGGAILQAANGDLIFMHLDTLDPVV